MQRSSYIQVFDLLLASWLLGLASATNPSPRSLSLYLISSDPDIPLNTNDTANLTLILKTFTDLKKKHPDTCFATFLDEGDFTSRDFDNAFGVSPVETEILMFWPYTDSSPTPSQLDSFPLKITPEPGNLDTHHLGCSGPTIPVFNLTSSPNKTLFVKRYLNYIYLKEHYLLFILRTARPAIRPTASRARRQLQSTGPTKTFTIDMLQHELAAVIFVGIFICVLVVSGFCLMSIDGPAVFPDKVLPINKEY